MIAHALVRQVASELVDEAREVDLVTAIDDVDGAGLGLLIHVAG